MKDFLLQITAATIAIFLVCFLCTGFACAETPNFLSETPPSFLGETVNEIYDTDTADPARSVLSFANFSTRIESSTGELTVKTVSTPLVDPNCKECQAVTRQHSRTVTRRRSFESVAGLLGRLRDRRVQVAGFLCNLLRRC